MVQISESVRSEWNQAREICRLQQEVRRLQRDLHAALDLLLTVPGYQGGSREKMLELVRTHEGKS